MFTEKTKKGFTIVELVIVILIIAILAAILIGHYSTVIKKANESKELQEAHIDLTQYTINKLYIINHMQKAPETNSYDNKTYYQADIAWNENPDRTTVAASHLESGCTRVMISFQLKASGLSFVKKFWWGLRYKTVDKSGGNGATGFIESESSEKSAKTCALSIRTDEDGWYTILVESQDKHFLNEIGFSIEKSAVDGEIYFWYPDDSN